MVGVIVASASIGIAARNPSLGTVSPPPTYTHSTKTFSSTLNPAVMPKGLVAVVVAGAAVERGAHASLVWCVRRLPA